MAFKKIEQDFVLSDSSINVLGFKLLTPGCVMDEVLKNPIGYFNHDPKDGVLCRWEDVRLSGDQILGKPVINMEHPRAERCIQEITDGFLNAASIAKICLLDYDFEENGTDEPTLVGRKWYYKEASIVESPGNRSAFKVALCDINDNEIKLSDLLGSARAHPDNFKLKNKKNMAKIELQLTPELIGMLELSDEPTAAQVSKGIKNLHEAKEDAEAELTELKDTVLSDQVDGMLDAALKGKKITAALRATFAKQYKGKPKELKAVLNDMGAFVSVTELINQRDTQREDGGLALTPAIQKLYDKGFDGLMKSGEMAQLKDASEPAYRELYKAKLGYYPNERPKPGKE